MNWKTINSSLVFDSSYVKVRKDDVLTESGIEIKDFYTVDVNDAVSILAITDEAQLILKKEYRYSRKSETIEIPAGMIEAEECDPLSSAKRELLEETGYESDKWSFIGAFAENTSKFTNTMYLYKAEGCIKTSSQKLDKTENIEVILKNLNDAVEMVTDNRISSMISAYAILYEAFKNQSK